MIPAALVGMLFLGFVLGRLDAMASFTAAKLAAAEG